MMPETRTPETRPLVVVESHPIQYHAPVYRAVQETYGIPVTVIYGSDFSVAGYRDREFGTSFSWSSDLIAGNEVRFLSRVAEGGARSFEEVSTRGLARALRAVRGSAVLLTGYSPAFNTLAFFEARKRGWPILLRAETSDRTAQRNSAKSAFRDWALRGIYAICARVLPIGSRSWEHYRRLGVAEEKMVFAPYCVNTASFQCEESHRERLRSATRGDLGLKDEDIALLFSGKLSVRKGVHVLTAAVKALPDSFRAKIVLLFLGAGAEQSAIADACADSPQIRVHFLGFRNQTELSPYYHAADMLVLPSVHGETWGLVVNEALHHGLPCVVSDAVGCAPDLIEEGRTGAVAEAQSPESLAAAIRRAAKLIGDPAARANCRAKVSRFSAQAAAEGIARAWREATARKRTRQRESGDSI